MLGSDIEDGQAPVAVDVKGSYEVSFASIRYSDNIT